MFLPKFAVPSEQEWAVVRRVVRNRMQGHAPLYSVGQQNKHFPSTIILGLFVYQFNRISERLIGLSGNWTGLNQPVPLTVTIGDDF